MPKTKYKFTTSMNLDVLVEKRLRERSRKTGASLSKLVEFALVEYLGMQEEFEAALEQREETRKRKIKVEEK